MVKEEILVMGVCKDVEGSALASRNEALCNNTINSPRSILWHSCVGTGGILSLTSWQACGAVVK